MPYLRATLAFGDFEADLRATLPFDADLRATLPFDADLRETLPFEADLRATLAFGDLETFGDFEADLRATFLDFFALPNLGMLVCLKKSRMVRLAGVARGEERGTRSCLGDSRGDAIEEEGGGPRMGEARGEGTLRDLYRLEPRS